MRGSGGMFHIEPQLTTRKRRIQTLVSHQLSSLFHREQKQISYKLLSINFHSKSCLSTLTNSCLSTLLYLFHDEQSDWKQLSYKILSINSYTNVCLSILIQTIVYQLSYKRLSLNSHTNSCLSTLIQTFVSQFSFKLLSINSHTNSCVSILIHALVYQFSCKLLSISTLTQTLFCQLSSLFHHEQGEWKQLSYKLLAIHSLTSENSLTLVGTTRV